MTDLVLIRHGQASFGGRNYDVLSPLGGRQSEVLGRHWSHSRFSAEVYYCGAMSRQRDTAEKTLAAAGIKADVQTNPAFNEYDFEGILRAYLPLAARENPQLKLATGEMFSDKGSFQQAFEIIIGYWLESRAHEGKPVESWPAFRDRVRTGLREVAPPERGRVAVFTSGGVITVALHEALRLDDRVAFGVNWRIANASRHDFRLGRRGLSLIGFNNTTHLELENDSSLLTFR